MADNTAGKSAPVAAAVARAPAVAFWQTAKWKTMAEQVWADNPIFRQILGICSALAVTNLFKNTLVMCAALVFVQAFSSWLVSLLRNVMPHRIRLVAQMVIIASFVILVDLVLKAFMYDTSKMLGPYVGLIITNCIVLGRCEGYAMRNPPLMSVLDGLGAALGYSVVLLAVALVREPLGFGTLLGYRVIPKAAWENWQIMVMAPGGFLMLGFFIWFARWLSPGVDAAMKEGQAQPK